MFICKQAYIQFFNCLILIVSIASCTDRDAEVDSCSFTVDTVKVIDSKTVDDRSYYLVLRISGWHEKVELLELYDEKPIFDHCSKASVEPVYGDSIEMLETVSHVFLNIKERKLDIVYKDGLPMKNQKDLIRLEIK